MTLKNNSKGTCPFYVASSFLPHSIATDEFKLELQFGNAHFVSKSAIFIVPCDLEMWRVALENNKAPPVSNMKL